MNKKDILLSVRRKLVRMYAEEIQGIHYINQDRILQAIARSIIDVEKLLKS
jgi:hypothetical protein